MLHLKHAFRAVILFGCLAIAHVTPAQHYNLWGTTFGGGTGGRGQIFKYNPGTDSLQYVYSFASFGPRDLSSGLIWDTAAKVFYGTTTYGGLSSTSQGTIFQYDPFSKKHTTIYDCYPQSVGQTPIAQLLQIGPDLLLGADYSGGQYSYGTIYTFRLSTRVKTARKHFWPAQGNGYDAYQGPVPAKNGKFYGLTHGSNSGIGSGALYELDTATNSYSMKKELTGMFGNQPFGRMLCLPGGRLLGTTAHAGAGNSGVLFEYDPAIDSIWVRHAFSQIATGASCMGSLMLHPNGKVYGMTSAGGAYNRGVLFEYDTLAKVLSAKYHFRDSTGGAPRGGLTVEANGKIYGCTGSYGLNGVGTLFEYDPMTNLFTAKKHFVGGGPLYAHMVGAWTNERPRLLATGTSDTVCSGGTSTISVAAADGDGDTLSAVFVSSNPAIVPASSAVFNYAGGYNYHLSYTAAAGASGDVELKGYVRDIYGGTSVDTFYVFIHVKPCGLSQQAIVAPLWKPVLSPNPFHESLTIESLPEPALRIVALNMIGHSTLLPFAERGRRSVVADTRLLLPGDYLLRVALADGSTHSFKITKAP